MGPVVFPKTEAPGVCPEADLAPEVMQAIVQIPVLALEVIKAVEEAVLAPEAACPVHPVLRMHLVIC